MGLHYTLVDLTQERLKALLNYDQTTGAFAWVRSAKGVKRSKGLSAGCRRHDGYVVIRIDNQLYLAHRLAWLYVHGVWPTHDIDHINGVRGDDRIVNLRDVPRVRNLENQRKAKPKNKAGLLGVTLCAGRYLARIQVAGRSRHLGSFDTAVEAHHVYLAAKRDLHAGCTL